jgi:hypothetical protein
MAGRNVWIYGAGIAIIVATVLWLAYVLYAAIAAMRALAGANLNTIDIAQNMTGAVVPWIAGFIANAIVLLRLRGRSKQFFRRAFAVATLGPAAATIASIVFFSFVSGLVFFATYLSAVPLQALLLGVGLVLLSAKSDQRSTS